MQHLPRTSMPSSGIEGCCLLSASQQAHSRLVSCPRWLMGFLHRRTTFASSPPLWSIAVARASPPCVGDALEARRHFFEGRLTSMPLNRAPQIRRSLYVAVAAILSALAVPVGLETQCLDPNLGHFPRLSSARRTRVFIPSVFLTPSSCYFHPSHLLPWSS